MDGDQDSEGRTVQHIAQRRTRSEIARLYGVHRSHNEAVQALSRGELVAAASGP